MEAWRVYHADHQLELRAIVVGSVRDTLCAANILLVAPGLSRGKGIAICRVFYAGPAVYKVAGGFAPGKLGPCFRRGKRRKSKRPVFETP